MATVRTVFRCVASRNRERTSRPRASATADGAKQKAGRASCITSVSAGSVGRRRRSAPMPTACTSTTAESTRRTLASMRTVFRCVASRDRERTLGPGPGLPRQRMARNRRRVGQVVERRLQRVRLVVDGGRRLCLSLVLQFRRALSAVQQQPCGRSSVVLPPGIGAARVSCWGSLRRISNRA